MRLSILLLLFSVLVSGSNVFAMPTLNEFTLYEVEDWSLRGDNFSNGNAAVMRGQNAAGDILQVTRSPGFDVTRDIFVTGGTVTFGWGASGLDLFFGGPGSPGDNINGMGIGPGLNFGAGFLSVTSLESGPVIPTSNPDVFTANVPVQLLVGVAYSYPAPNYPQDELVRMNGTIDGIASYRLERGVQNTLEPNSYFYNLTNVDYTFDSAPANTVPEPTSVVVWSLLGLVAMAWSRHRSLS